MDVAEWRKAMAQEIWEVSGVRFTPEQVGDVDFCVKEIARRGYSMSMTFLPIGYLEAGRAARGVPIPEEERRSVGEGVYTYQLLGGKYESRGDHDCPCMATAQECAATALMNVCRMERKYGPAATDWLALRARRDHP